jgi:hypothetical protein
MFLFLCTLKLAVGIIKVRERYLHRLTKKGEKCVRGPPVLIVLLTFGLILTSMLGPQNHNMRKKGLCWKKTQ